MSTYRKITKCPGCCPDGGAEFKANYLGSGRWEWKCTNCHYTTSRRVLTPKDRPTNSQNEIVCMLKDLFGGTIEQQMIGRNLWVSLENNARQLYNGYLLYGTIGVRGKLNLTLVYATPYLKDVKIRTGIDVKVYLKA